jgi:hypothetical protein
MIFSEFQGDTVMLTKIAAAITSAAAVVQGIIQTEEKVTVRGWNATAECLSLHRLNLLSWDKYAT